jgi:hypothetical protein
VRDRVEHTLPTLTSLVEGACQYKQQERTGTRWQRCMHPTICLPRNQSSFALFGVYLDIAAFVPSIQAPTSPSARCHVLLLTYSSSRVATTNNTYISSSRQQHTLANNNIYPTHGASCSTHNAASRLGHGTNLRLRCFHCRYCATELQRDAVSSHCRRRVEVDQGPGRGQGEVKPAPPRPISNLQSLSAPGKAVADQTSSKRQRQCPPRFPHPAVEPASPGFCERVGHGSG